MTPYQETLLALAAESEAAAVALWAQVDELGDRLFAAALAAILARYNGRAASLAVTAFSAQASIATATPTAVDLLPVADDNERLTKAATTVIDGARKSDVPEAIIGRLARSEPLNTAARTYSDTLATSPLVEGWTRHMDAAPASSAAGGGEKAASGPNNTPSKPTPDAPAYQDPFGANVSSPPATPGNSKGTKHHDRHQRHRRGRKHRTKPG